MSLEPRTRRTPTRPTSGTAKSSKRACGRRRGIPSCSRCRRSSRDVFLEVCLDEFLLPNSPFGSLLDKLPTDCGERRAAPGATEGARRHASARCGLHEDDFAQDGESRIAVARATMGLAKSCRSRPVAGAISGATNHPAGGAATSPARFDSDGGRRWPGRFRARMSAASWVVSTSWTWQSALRRALSRGFVPRRPIRLTKT